MQLKLTLHTTKGDTIPINYQYPLSAAIYKILDSANQDYAKFLHDTGYQKEGSAKSFKLFTFSDISVPFKIKGDRLILLAPEIELWISFHIPQAAENFVKGIFQHQAFDIADKKSKVTFTVFRMESIPFSLNLAGEQKQEVILTPKSPLVCGKKNEKGNYDFLSPEHPDFIKMLLYNLKEKYAILNGADQADMVIANTTISVLPAKNGIRSRLITIKAGTPAETKIRGFVDFQLKVKSTVDALELLVNAGGGLYNSLGFGYLSM